ncbi:MFS transporter [Plantactinospora sp. WMMB334]|uniref:MFS transporter n=1 Tax=Plantactinospora sp. WMMB334 TaxID=3404119 RepID=UPI003B965007
MLLGTCCLSLFAVVMDASIMAVALPAMRADLDATISQLQWTIGAYSVTLSSLLVLAGSTADRVGRRLIFQGGLVVFGAGSLLCSLAPTLQWLVVARVVQAIGAAALNPVALAIITNTFVHRSERVRAIGAWSAVVGVSMALGPLLGGGLVDAAGWRAIFLINLPVVLAALTLTALVIPESRAVRARRLDPVGQGLLLTMLAAGAVTVIEGPNVGWTSPQTVVTITIAIAASVGLIGYETRRVDPLLELGYFRRPAFTGATVLAVATFSALSGLNFLGSLYLQEVRGLSALQAGTYTLPLAVMTLLVAPLSGRLVGSHGPRLPLLIGGAGLTTGPLLLTGLTADTSPGRLLAAYALFGLGFGAVNPPITASAVSGMPAAQAGTAAAIVTAGRQLGQALGVAGIGSVLASGLHGAPASGIDQAGRVGWWIVSACGLAVLVVGLVVTGQRRPAAHLRVALPSRSGSAV